MSVIRRSRMRRCSTGKRIAITERDIAIFRTLARYRYLRSTYLYAFAGGASETRFKERLGDLYHEGYLERPESQWRYADARHRPAVHELADAGRRCLSDAGVFVDDQRTWLRNPQRQYEHALMTCEVLASIELGLPRGARFISWPEILAKAPTSARKEGPVAFEIGGQKLVPDALFGIGYTGASGTESYRFFAVEIDRGTMPVVRSLSSQTAFLPKLAGYSAVLRQGLFKTQLGLPNLLVLTVTIGDSRRHTMIDALAAMPDDSGAFLFGYVAQPASTPVTSLISSPWLRARCGSVDLSRPSA